MLTVVPGSRVRGGGNPANQVQDGSAVSSRRSADPAWTTVPLTFLRRVGNDKYYSAAVPTDSFRPGDDILYYLRVAYDDHDTTFAHGPGEVSAPTGDEANAQAAPFAFTVADPAEEGRCGPVFGLPNMAIHTHVLPDGRVLM